MQKVEYLKLMSVFVGDRNGAEKDISELGQKVAGLRADGWTVDSIIPLSYHCPIGDSGTSLHITEVALLISK